MSPQVIIITGGAGFLGSAITVDLNVDHKVAVIDRRQPSAALLASAPGATWHQVDIAHPDEVESVFRQTRRQFGGINVVVHFAAFYHFDTDWHPEYERTNLQGTANVLRSAIANGARGVVFASSIAALRPPPSGAALTEETAPSDYLPYAKSKCLGEQIVIEASQRLSGIVLRIAAAFSDWCELPPLASLIRLWCRRWPLGRFMPGRGGSGMPYIHRDDVVRLVRSCVEQHERLSACEVFLASPDGAVLHRDLFPVIHAAGKIGPPRGPIFVSPKLAKIGLHAGRVIGRLAGRVPFERPWMLDYVDRPWVVDAAHTRRRLDWSCTAGLGILDRLPVILEHFLGDRPLWVHRNRVRTEGRYAYS